MLEVAVCLAAKRTEEAGNESHAIRVSLIVNLAVEMLLVQLLHFDAVVLVCDVMLAVTIIAITGTREIAVFHGRSRH
jgi:hypothetical protein